MRRVFLSTVIAFLLLFVSTSSTYAAFITIDKNGKVIWNVLASEDESTFLTPKPKAVDIKNVAYANTPLTDAKILLQNNDGKTTLDIESKSGDTQTDVTNYQDNLIEIEERPDIKKLRISHEGGAFIMEQNGIYARTEYPIQVDSKTSHLSLVAPTGVRFLSILPYDVIENMVRANIINDISRDDNAVTLKENTKGDLQYIVAGHKNFRIFSFYSLSVPVTAYMSANSGQVTNIDSSIWYKVLGLLFS